MVKIFTRFQTKSAKEKHTLRRHCLMLSLHIGSPAHYTRGAGAFQFGHLTWWETVQLTAVYFERLA